MDVNLQISRGSETFVLSYPFTAHFDGSSEKSAQTGRNLNIKNMSGIPKSHGFGYSEIGGLLHPFLYSLFNLSIVI